MDKNGICGTEIPLRGPWVHAAALCFPCLAISSTNVYDTYVCVVSHDVDPYILFAADRSIARRA